MRRFPLLFAVVAIETRPEVIARRRRDHLISVLSTVGALIGRGPWRP